MLSSSANAHTKEEEIWYISKLHSNRDKLGAHFGVLRPFVAREKQKGGRGREECGRLGEEGEGAGTGEEGEVHSTHSNIANVCRKRKRKNEHNIFPSLAPLSLVVSPSRSCSCWSCGGGFLTDLVSVAAARQNYDASTPLSGKSLCL